jgi:hypothetical protein
MTYINKREPLHVIVIEHGFSKIYKIIEHGFSKIYKNSRELLGTVLNFKFK